MNVLITGGGTLTANNVIKTLKKIGRFRIIATDINKKEFVAAAYFSDRYHRVPFGTDKNFIPRLLKIARKEKIDVIIPILDEELLPISKNRKKFERIGANIVISEPETITLCNDKYKTYLFFRENRIPTPLTFLPQQTVKIKNSDFPLIVKPRSGKGSVGISRAFGRKGLFSILQREKDVVVQKFIQGEEYTIDTFSNRKYSLMAAVPRLRIEVKSGVSYKGKTIRDLYLMKMAAKIIKLAKISGPANIQCIKLKNRFYFTEINPRFSGGLPLTVKAGVNTPLMAINLAQDKKVTKHLQFKPNLHMVRYVKEIFF